MVQLTGVPSTWYSWTPSYFSQVAQRCDQIAVMSYDLVNVFPWSYVEALTNQVRVVSDALTSSNCAAIFGLSTYDRNFFHDHCETLRLGLKAVREGWIDNNPKLSGVALFADYTTDEREWKEFNELWVQR